MLKLKSFTVNPFQQNTYLIWNSQNEAAIIDPGNSNNTENQAIKNFIEANNLTLKRLLLTHAHIDHVMGNKFIFDEYKLLPEMHVADLFFIEKMTDTAHMYGVNCEQSPNPTAYINDNDIITLGELTIKCIHTPGHSPGSISFYFEKERVLISGDVLFYGSIGRTDLPMGNHETLISSIKNKLFHLGDDVKVYSGHGPATSIGFEKASNPF
ncbi:MAG: MBL fold metallo-hydrolase, partial [Bacteroidia bacterium]|nr:MBL fold metallo-hydrolase [Bacteroidia bacterium]